MTQQLTLSQRRRLRKAEARVTEAQRSYERAPVGYRGSTWRRLRDAVTEALRAVSAPRTRRLRGRA